MMLPFPNNRKGLAPIALAAEKPVAQFVIDPATAQMTAFEPLDDPLLRLGRAQAVQEIGIDRGSFIADVANRFHSRRRLHNFLNWQLELARKFEVSFIVARNRHDRPGAVAHQNVVGDPDRNTLLVRGIDCV